MAKHDWQIKYFRLKTVYACTKCGRIKPLSAAGVRRPGGAIGLKKGGCR